jgi:HEPN domain-containing protein
MGAHQAVGKYLKAVLAIEQERPERTHFLRSLATQCENAGWAFPTELEGVFDLGKFAVEGRYPFQELPIDRTAALELVQRVERSAAAALHEASRGGRSG